ncbi:TetR family transcriptional regulator [Rhodococcus olei]|uniref:TetR family transcriptional regulator n=1 Tax=Rhodococcus olei TaxID=2161675 RepID=UPI0031EDBD10
MGSSSTPGLRGITREAVRTRIAEVAIDLFAEQGFDAVTVEQIAAEVGISARSFHRYFPAKEDAVIGDLAPWGEFVRDAFAARPADEPVWDSLRSTFEALLAQPSRDEQRSKRTMRVLTSTASLRARNLEKHLLWARLLTPLAQERLTGDLAALRAQTLVQAALVCFDIALTTWAEPDETTDAVELLRQSFATLAPRNAGIGPTKAPYIP